MQILSRQRILHPRRLHDTTLVDVNIETAVSQVLNRRVTSVRNNVISVSITIDILEVDIVVSTSASRSTVSGGSNGSKLPVGHITARRLQIQEDTSSTTGSVELNVVSTTVRVNVDDLSVDTVDDAAVQRRRDDTLVDPSDSAILELVEPNAEGTVGSGVDVVGSSIAVEVLELDADTWDAHGRDGEGVAVEVHGDLRVDGVLVASVCVDRGGTIGVDDDVLGAVVGVNIGETDLGRYVSIVVKNQGLFNS